MKVKSKIICYVYWGSFLWNKSLQPTAKAAAEFHRSTVKIE